MLGWFGERLKPSQNIPAPCISACKAQTFSFPGAASSAACQRGICQSFRKALQSPGKDSEQGRGCRHKLCAAPEPPEAPEPHPWAAQEENSQLCPGFLPQSTAQPPWRRLGILVPALPRRAKHSPPQKEEKNPIFFLPAEKSKSGNHSMVWLEGTSQLISFLPLPWDGLITFH